jgi:two-component system sensor histidine kinase HydH
MLEVAARASINERCALAYLHDVRGSMQSLFSAVELLSRSARGGGNPERIDRACDLARRAINQHEKTTLGALEILTLQHIEATAIELGPLLREVIHFLRNEAGAKDVTIRVSGDEDLRISAERAKLQTLLMGLLTAALDALPSGSSLEVSMTRSDEDALVTVGSAAGYSYPEQLNELMDRAHGRLEAKELTFLFAKRFLAANGGRLGIDPTAGAEGQLTIRYPLFASSRSFAAIRASGTEK